MLQTLIVPGLDGSPTGHWQHSWAAADAAAEIVEQEDWAVPRLSDWLHALEARIAASTPGVVLVGHSLGCSLIAALAGRVSAHHVGGALLVAPVDVAALSDARPSVRTFEGTDRSALPFDSIVVASRNDPFLSFAGARRRAAVWGSAFYDLGEAGHVNIASGFGPWPDAATLADGLRGRRTRSPVPPAASRRGRRDSSSWFAGSHDSGLGIN